MRSDCNFERKTEMNWILAFTGLLIYFLSRYANRSNKSNPSLKFWWKDNWPEFTQSILWVFALMSILTSDNAVVDSRRFQDWINKYINFPDGMVLPAKMVISFLLGLFISKIQYWYNKSKEKWSIMKDRIIEPN